MNLRLLDAAQHRSRYRTRRQRETVHQQKNRVRLAFVASCSIISRQTFFDTRQTGPSAVADRENRSTQKARLGWRPTRQTRPERRWRAGAREIHNGTHAGMQTGRQTLTHTHTHKTGGGNRSTRHRVTRRPDADSDPASIHSSILAQLGKRGYFFSFFSVFFLPLSFKRSGALPPAAEAAAAETEAADVADDIRGAAAADVLLVGTAPRTSPSETTSISSSAHNNNQYGVRSIREPSDTKREKKGANGPLQGRRRQHCSHAGGGAINQSARKAADRKLTSPNDFPL